MKNLIVALMMLIFVGCMGIEITNYNHYDINGNTVTLGMSTKEVKDLLGPPTRISVWDAKYALGSMAPDSAVMWLYGDMKAGDSEMLVLTIKENTIIKIEHHTKS